MISRPDRPHPGEVQQPITRIDDLSGLAAGSGMKKSASDAASMSDRGAGDENQAAGRSLMNMNQKIIATDAFTRSWLDGLTRKTL